MSRLQNVVNTLIDIIINYYERNLSKKIPPDLSLAKSHEDRMAALDQLIKAAAPEHYKERLPLLEYVRYVVNELKPLADKETFLSKDETDQVQKTLVSFVANCGVLLNTNQNSKLSIPYDDKMVEIKGCLRGIIGQYAYAVSGQVLNDLLFSPRAEISFPLFSSAVQDKISLGKIEHMIATFIAEHQMPLENKALRLQLEIEKEQVKQLSEEQASTLKQRDAAKINHDALLKAYQDLENQLKMEQQNRASEQAIFTAEQVRKNEQIESLTQENTLLKGQLAKNEDAYNQLNKEVAELREINSNLRYLTTKPNGDPIKPPRYQSIYGTSYFGLSPFFGSPSLGKHASTQARIENGNPNDSNKPVVLPNYS